MCLGAPVPRSPELWRLVREAASGRVINAYSARDGLLVGAASLWAVGNLAGLRPVGMDAAPPLRAAEAPPPAPQAPQLTPQAPPAPSAALRKLFSGLFKPSGKKGGADAGGGGGAGEGEGGGASSDDEGPLLVPYEADDGAIDLSLQQNWGESKLPASQRLTRWWHGVENVDLSAHVQSHVDWERKLDIILKTLGV